MFQFLNNLSLTITVNANLDILVQKRFLDETYFLMLRSFEPYSYECFLNKMVEKGNNTMSSASNTAVTLKIKKRSTDKIFSCLNNNNVNEIKRICQAAEIKWKKTRLTVHCNIYKEAITVYNKAI